MRLPRLAKANLAMTEKVHPHLSPPPSRGRKLFRLILTSRGRK